MKPRPPIAWRHSSISVLLGTPDHKVEQFYCGCPAAFQQEYLRGMEPESGDPATIGIVNHAIAAAWARWLVDRKIKFSKWNAEKFHDRYLELAQRVIEAEKPAPHLYDDIMANADLWFFSFELKQPDAHHIFETRMYFGMDWQPLVPLDKLRDKELVRSVLQAEYTAGRDTIGMTADRIWHSGEGEISFSDLKFGHTARGLDVTDQARHNEQLQFYTRGIFAMFPEIDNVNGSIWGVLGGERNVSQASWYRGSVEEAVQARLDKAVGLADALWMVHGEDDWPAVPDNSVCRFCSRVGGCPLAGSLLQTAEESFGIPA